MMMTVLLQLDGLNDVQRAVRDQFQRGGSVAGVLLVLLVLLAVVLAVYYLTQCQRKVTQAARRHDPQRLFRHLLNGLDLSAPQRHLLLAVAKDLRLKQPTVILLSPTLFDLHVKEWQTGQSGPVRTSAAIGNHPDAPEQTAAQTRSVLFPQSQCIAQNESALDAAAPS